MIGYVYAVKAGPFVKIGYATSPRARYHMIRVDCPFDAELIGVNPGNRGAEAAFHAQFSKWHSRGEWFHWTPEIEAVVSEWSAISGERRKAVKGANILRDWLRRNDIAASRFAERAGILPSTMTRILNGDRVPRMATIEKICAATNDEITPDDFLLFVSQVARRPEILVPREASA